jgi:hypothetical protein
MLTDEWRNFFERIEQLHAKDGKTLKSMMSEISVRASHRGQTLARTGKVANSLEHTKHESKDEEFLKTLRDDISLWASYRGQTLTRTGKVTNSLVLNEHLSC